MRKPGDSRQKKVFPCNYRGCVDIFKQNSGLVFHMKDIHGVEL